MSKDGADANVGDSNSAAIRRTMNTTQAAWKASTMCIVTRIPITVTRTHL